MILYHGSSRKLSTIKKSQARAGEGISVPEGELLDAIYLTPDLGFAIAVAAMPEGETNIDYEDRTIEFEKPELFDPEKEIFVYEVDADKTLKKRLSQIDEKQYAIVDLNEIRPDAVRRFRAAEVMKYYELTNWKKEGREIGGDVKFK